MDMASRYFTADYVEHAVLHDGTEVVLRLLVPEDKELLRAGFERLSWQSRYMRFLVPKQRLSDEELRYLCEIDQENHFALGAVRAEGDGHGNPVGLGVARFIRLPDQPGEPVTAEAAVAVADEVQGQGLGKLLLLRLVAAANERGIQRFRSEILGANASMQSLIEKLAPDHTEHVAGGVVTLDFPLPTVDPQQPPTEPAPGGPMYAFFRAAARGAIEWTEEAVRRLWRRLPPAPH